MLLKTNFIVMTGGPGAGKSTLLNALCEKGFNFISETGRAIIKDRLSKNLPPRPEVNEFAKQMFRIDCENYTKNINTTELLFFDRSFLDSAAMIQQTDEAYFENIRNIMDSLRFNTRVFIAPPWEEIYCNDNERDQTFEEAIDTYEKLSDWYTLNGYKLVIIPRVSVRERVRFVLDEVMLLLGKNMVCRS